MYFNPLGRKTETKLDATTANVEPISIHSVARPRQLSSTAFNRLNNISIHSVARPRLKRYMCPLWIIIFQSTRSQDRDALHNIGARTIEDFNPLGRKTETTMSMVAHMERFRKISIHSVARPRQKFLAAVEDKTVFQSTRSQDRDKSTS